MKLSDKVIMITGAASGIGKATSLVCSGYGAKIVAVDMNEAALVEVVKEIEENGGEAIAAVANVTDRKSVKQAVKDAIAAFGKIDCLFNNAGVVRPQLLVDCTDEEYDFTMNINAKGSFIVATEVAKQMIPNKKGRIINASSIAALKEEYGNGLYNMSKAAVSMLTKVLAAELGEYNISTVAICPGHIDTDLLRKAFTERGAAENKNVDEFYKEMEDTITLGRLGTPEEVGELVAFLCDDRSAYMDGNSILFCGGKLM